MNEAEGITLTNKAIEMGKQKVADAGEPVHGLRLGIKGGGLLRVLLRVRLSPAKCDPRRTWCSISMD